jgi:hypothetical protein
MLRENPPPQEQGSQRPHRRLSILLFFCVVFYLCGRVSEALQMSFNSFVIFFVFYLRGRGR